MLFELKVCFFLLQFSKALNIYQKISNSIIFGIELKMLNAKKCCLYLHSMYSLRSCYIRAWLQFLRFQKNSLIWTSVYNSVWQLYKGLAVTIAFKYVLIVKYTLDAFFIRKLFSSVMHKCYLLYWRHCLTEARHILYVCRYVYV